MPLLQELLSNDSIFRDLFETSNDKIILDHLEKETNVNLKQLMNDLFAMPTIKLNPYFKSNSKYY